VNNAAVFCGKNNHPNGNPVNPDSDKEGRQSSSAGNSQFTYCLFLFIDKSLTESYSGQVVLCMHGKDRIKSLKTEFGKFFVPYL
jgi:hypothetical protein